MPNPDATRHSDPSTIRVVSVTVAHRPDSKRLQAQLRALASQVHCRLVVDNAASPQPAGTEQSAVLQALADMHDVRSPMIRIAPGHNLGLAAAQNLGATRAIAEGASHLLLMDDDSLPQPHMVDHLLQALKRHPQAAAVGPWYFDTRQPLSHRPFVQIRGLSRRHLDAAPQPQEVDHLIASGCLIPVAMYQRVGPMREDFFIDFVDVEWCLRARRLGLSVYGVSTAQLEHCLGGEPVKWLGQRFLNHSPWRLYFQVRNACAIYREPWVPLNWKLVSAWRLLLKVAFRSLVGPKRFEQTRHAWAGLCDAVRGRRRMPDEAQR